MENENNVVERLWATIMYYDLGENPLDVNVLYDGKLNESVMWSFNASTRSMRVLVDDMTGDFIRYGDWLQSTISYDDTIRYMALNLVEKEEDDKVLKMICEDEEIQEASTVRYKDVMNDHRIKTVKDVVFKFTGDAGQIDERPNVKITDMKTVTKEATNRKDIFMANLENQFEQNMIYIDAIMSDKGVEGNV